MIQRSIPIDVRRNPEFRKTILPQIRSRQISPEEIRRLLEENAEFYNGIDVGNVIGRFNFLVEDIRRNIVNRENITRQAVRALITGEHLFIFSSAGVAKSLFANQLFAYFKNSSVFSIQFSPDTTPDDLFGGYDLERFKRGEVFHNIEGSILTSPFAFLDEFMDANDKILRTLLGVLLERKFMNGSQEEEALLHTTIATSNYVRRSETTMALLDRFLYKSFIDPRKDLFTLMQIGHVYDKNAGQVRIPPEEMLIDIRELHFLRDIVHNRNGNFAIEIPPEIEYLKNLTAATFETEMKKYRDNFYLSPRTITKSNDLLRANALLRGEKNVTMDDVRELHYLFAVLHEPIDKESGLTSEELFARVVQKRIQYFQSIRDDIAPLLYILDYLQALEERPEMLKSPLTFLKNKAEKSVIRGLIEKLLKAFDGKESSGVNENKEKILGYLRDFRSEYRELNDFSRKTYNFAVTLFHQLEQSGKTAN